MIHAGGGWGNSGGRRGGPGPALQAAVGSDAPPQGEVTVRLVRRPDGSSHLTRIACAGAWVLRAQWLRPEDLE